MHSFPRTYFLHDVTVLRCHTRELYSTNSSIVNKNKKKKKKECVILLVFLIYKNTFILIIWDDSIYHGGHKRAMWVPYNVRITSIIILRFTDDSLPKLSVVYLCEKQSDK